jgi:hypothetical protein
VGLTVSNSGNFMKEREIFWHFQGTFITSLFCNFFSDGSHTKLGGGGTTNTIAVKSRIFVGFIRNIRNTFVTVNWYVECQTNNVDTLKLAVYVL